MTLVETDIQAEILLHIAAMYYRTKCCNFVVLLLCVVVSKRG